MDVRGPKLLDDERFTQDLILVSPASFVTPNVRESAKLQYYVRDRTNLFYFINPADPHLLAGIMQALYSRMHTSPLETRYYSNVPFLLGEGQAVQYSLRPRSAKKTRIPVRASDNYLGEAMARTLAPRPCSFRLHGPGPDRSSSDADRGRHRQIAERLSPYVPVAELRLPRQRFDSPAQLEFADHLSCNPWHSLEAHRPLANQNRARRRMYHELSRLRQSMNQRDHVEPTGSERFPAARSSRALKAAATPTNGLDRDVPAARGREG